MTNDNSVDVKAARRRFDRQTLKIEIGHKLAGLTQRDDTELLDEIQRLTRGHGFTPVELSEICIFAAAVARAQASQLDCLVGQMLEGVG